MPMNATTLSSALKPAIIAEMNSQFGPPQDPQYLEKMATAVAKAVAEKVVEHITANAQVSVNVTVNPGQLVTTAGTAAAQSGSTTTPGTGTGTGTIA